MPIEYSDVCAEFTVIISFLSMVVLCVVAGYLIWRKL